jgi:hypothetical protein
MAMTTVDDRETIVGRSIYGENQYYLQPASVVFCLRAQCRSNIIIQRNIKADSGNTEIMA